MSTSALLGLFRGALLGGIRPLLRALVLEAALAAGLSGQDAILAGPPLTPSPGARDRCVNSSFMVDPIVARIGAAMELVDPEEARRRLGALEPAVREEAAAAPGNVIKQYRLVALLGARANVVSGRDALGVVEELLPRIDAVLALDPDHAGAHHILGRLHAAGMRMGRIERFLARTLFDGGVLGSLSWKKARHHLERAEAADPCDANHHYELARLYAERDERTAALEELLHVETLLARGASAAAELATKSARLGAALRGG